MVISSLARIQTSVKEQLEKKEGEVNFALKLIKLKAFQLVVTCLSASAPFTTYSTGEAAHESRATPLTPCGTSTWQKAASDDGRCRSGQDFVFLVVGQVSNCFFVQGQFFFKRFRFHVIYLLFILDTK